MSGAHPHILIVEDNKADLFLVREAIERAGIDAKLHILHDGESAIQFFEQRKIDASLPCPSLVIIDINLPRNGRCSQALVLVVTSSDFARDREQMSEFGPNGYFRKPSEYEEFMKLGELVKNLLGRLHAS